MVGRNKRDRCGVLKRRPRTGSAYDRRLDVDGILHCEHCNRNLRIGRTTYYDNHHRGRCKPAAPASPCGAIAAGASLSNATTSGGPTDSSGVQSLSAGGLEPGADEDEDEDMLPADDSDGATADMDWEAAAPEGGIPPEEEDGGWSDASSEFDEEEDSSSSYYSDSSGLDDLEAEEPADADQQHRDADTQGTAAYYRARKDAFVYNGAVITVIGAVFLFLLLKITTNISDGGFDMLCRAIHEIILPAGNLFPPSLYLMKRIAGVEDLDQYEYHICPECERHVYPRARRKEWHRCMHDTCPVCAQLQRQSPRFNQVARGGKIYLEPRKYFFYFGVANAIKRMFALPEFREARATNRTYADRSTWWGSTDARRMNQQTRGALFDEKNSPYSLAFDFVDVFNFKDWSTGMATLRCDDLPFHLRDKRMYAMPVLIIPGPSMPNDVSAYMSLIAQEFHDLGPNGTRRLQVAAGEEVLEHIPLLSTLHADTPGRTKAANFAASASAYLACQFCWFSGDRYAAYGRSTLFRGYRQEVTMKHGLLKGQKLQMGVNDQARMLSHNEQRERADLMEMDVPGAVAQETGCHGWCVFPQMLPYLDYNNFFVLPWYHAAYLGLTQDLWKLITGKLGNGPEERPFLMSHAAKRAMAQHEKDFILTADFGRPFTSLLSKSGRYVVENWVRWTEIFSTYLLCPEVHGQELLPQLAKKAWGHLRRFLLHHQRKVVDPQDPAGQGSSYHEANRAAAQAELIEYAKLMDEHYPRLCKQNLHLLTCRLHIQEAQRGSVYHETELWLERVLQWLKSRVKYHTTAVPEKVMGNMLLLDMALTQLRADNPTLKSFDEWVPAYRAGSLVGEQYDDDYAAPDRLLFTGQRQAPSKNVGHGITWAGDIKPAVSAYITDAIRQGVAGGWQVADLERTAELQVWLHSAAYIHNDEIVTSRLHRLSRTRESWYIQVEYSNQLRVAEVQYYVRCQMRERATLRIAVCNLYRHMPTWADRDLGQLLRARVFPADPAATFERQGWAIGIAAIDTKLMAACCKRTGQGHHDLYLQKTSMASGLH